MSTSSSDANDYNANEASYFMKQALHVAKAALDIGEVPVGMFVFKYVFSMSCGGYQHSQPINLSPEAILYPSRLCHCPEGWYQQSECC